MSPQNPISGLLFAVVYMASLAYSRDIAITARGSEFVPKTVQAVVGDVLVFHFEVNNHSVVMGNWDCPCAPASAGGFFSGFQPVPQGQKQSPNVFRVQINDTNPLVFYCSQNDGSHCKQGMAGAVNAPQTRLDMYICNATGVDLASSPPGIFGGVLDGPGSSSVPGYKPPPASTGTPGLSPGYGPPDSPPTNTPNPVPTTPTTTTDINPPTGTTGTAGPPTYNTGAGTETAKTATQTPTIVPAPPAGTGITSATGGAVPTPSHTGVPPPGHTHPATNTATSTGTGSGTATVNSAFKVSGMAAVKAVCIAVVGLLVGGI